jgi:pimeloyl-ACP methyl ester carboxylesterase
MTTGSFTQPIMCGSVWWLLLSAPLPTFNAFASVNCFDRFFPDLSAKANQDLQAALRGVPGAARDFNLDNLGLMILSPEIAEAARQFIDLFTFYPDEFLQLSNDWMATDLTASVQSIRVPTLIVHGQYDLNVAPVVAIAVQKMITGSELVMLKKSGHAAFLEQPDEFLAAVLRFLKK